VTYLNTAIISILYRGSPNGPAELDRYPESLYSQDVGTGLDSLGYGTRDCGSAVAQWKLLDGCAMPPKSVLGLPGHWAAKVDPSWIVTDPQPGDIAVIPSNSALPKGHAIYVSCVAQGTTNIVGKSYNTMETGDFEIGLWALSGSIGTTNFNLVLIRVPAVSGAHK